MIKTSKLRYAILLRLEIVNRPGKSGSGKTGQVHK
jgi:hypothetical protein